MAAIPMEGDGRLIEALIAYLDASERGQPNRQAVLERYPEFSSELNEIFANQSHFGLLAAPLRQLAEAAQAEVKARRTISLEGKGRATPAADKVRSFGDYELLEEIARGGMGVVYKARQVSLNRVVAVKMILKGELASSSDVQRFRNEA